MEWARTMDEDSGKGEGVDEENDEAASWVVEAMDLWGVRPRTLEEGDRERRTVHKRLALLTCPDRFPYTMHYCNRSSSR